MPDINNVHIELFPEGVFDIQTFIEDDDPNTLRIEFGEGIVSATFFPENEIYKQYEIPCLMKVGE